MFQHYSLQSSHPPSRVGLFLKAQRINTVQAPPTPLSTPMANTANQSSLRKRLPNPSLNTMQAAVWINWVDIWRKQFQAYIIITQPQIRSKMYEGCTIFHVGWAIFFGIFTSSPWWCPVLKIWLKYPLLKEHSQTSDGKGWEEVVRSNQFHFLLPLTICLSFTQLQSGNVYWVPLSSLKRKDCAVFTTKDCT